MAGTLPSRSVREDQGGFDVPVVGHSQILRVHAAAIATGLAAKRDALLAGLSRRLVADLRSDSSPDAQLLGDLDHLNDCGRLPDGSIPLQTWLENAVALCAPRAEVEVFREVLALVQASGGAATVVAGPAPERREDAAAREDRVLRRIQRSFSLAELEMFIRKSFPEIPGGLSGIVAPVHRFDYQTMEVVDYFKRRRELGRLEAKLDEALGPAGEDDR